jgi:pSer/pThr/pTyr-binding forkhead associated (FHA) protein
MFGAFQLFRIGATPAGKASTPNRLPAQKATLEIKHGPLAGKSFSLNGLPVLIGRDPQNDICINDPHVINQHAQIYSKKNGYYLRDLGGGTFINGQPVKSSTVVLHRGDVVRLGKSVLFVFG